MSDTNVKAAAPAFPILGLLGLLFIGLKLTGHVAWSWWWVLAPFWLPFAVAVFLILLAGAIAWLASK